MGGTRNKAKEAKLQMQFTDARSEVNSENKIIQNGDSPGVAWGARAIGQTIGRTERQAHYMLEWQLTGTQASDLRREFGI